MHKFIYDVEIWLPKRRKFWPKRTLSVIAKSHKNVREYGAKKHGKKSKIKIHKHVGKTMGVGSIHAGTYRS